MDEEIGDDFQNEFLEDDIEEDAFSNSPHEQTTSTLEYEDETISSTDYSNEDIDTLYFNKDDSETFVRSDKMFKWLMKQRWSRCSVDQAKCEREGFAVFLLEGEYWVTAPSTEPLIAQKMDTVMRNLLETPVIQLYGVTRDGNSVLAHVHGFAPYLYCECPKNAVNPEILRAKIEAFLVSAGGVATGGRCVLGIDIVQKQHLMNFRYEATQKFFRITVSQPRFVATTRRYIETGINLSPSGCDFNYNVPPIAYEANVPFVLRFMVDQDIRGCSWFTLPPRVFKIRPQHKYRSNCQLEVDIHYSDLVPHEPDGEWLQIAPLRIFSFDIECVKLQGKGFPLASVDPVIQISCIVAVHGASERVVKAIFTLGTCSPIAGATVLQFSDESTMLSRWQALMLAVDPDILTGYNCINFDMNYLIERSDVLKIPTVKLLGRMRNVQSRVKDSRISSRALGTHLNKDINIAGRVQLDILEAVRRDYKLKSYSLNAVSAHFLKEQKEDVHYSMIGDLHRGNAETRKRVAVYCLKDAELPLRLLDKLLLLYNFVEMARVTGVPFTYLLTRGQQIKVTSQLLRKCLSLDIVVPSVRPAGGDHEVAYEGATVLDPKKGFYQDPIATLDFASLYPSIMMAYNLCYCTLIAPELVHTVPLADRVTTPSGNTFIRKTVREGVLPMIVGELIGARKRARAEIAKQSDPFVKAVLNGRQLALKISANSVYGFTGATSGGQLPCLEISTSITAYGRQMIDKTKEMVESTYTVSAGHEFDADVVYGDTDSVMVKFGTDDIAEAMRLGRDAAARMTEQFPPPIRLEFEKVFCPFMLMNKKRYAGLLYSRPEKYDYIDCKGIETVRRDFCLLVQQLIDASLNKILIERDVEGAKENVKRTVSELLQHKVDMSLLVMSKSLGKEEYTAKMAHVTLAKKLKNRDPATAPQIGDRVHYVVVQGGKKQPQFDRAEDPVFVLENNLAIDTEHYVEALKKPLIRVFEGVMDDPSLLFSGAHMMKRKVVLPSTGGLSAFVKQSLRCLGCKAPISEGALCKHCIVTKEREMIMRKVKVLSECQKDFSDLWTQCQRCQGSVHQDVLCTSRDCPIFYRRTKIRKDLQEAQKQVTKLHTSW
eukprot:Lankesteria_metandrocarpae@DN5381_c0_g1_i2.p1